MIVVMAAGLSANLTANPFEAVTTVTVQIVTLLVGDQEFDSPKTLAAFALGLALFFFTLALNVAALRIVRKGRADETCLLYDSGLEYLLAAVFGLRPQVEADSGTADPAGGG